MKNIGRFRTFVVSMTRLVDQHAQNESAILDDAAELVRSLVIHDDWIPREFTVPSSHAYRQYLLHCDALERFCVVSFVWLPTQRTPVHDHLTWGVIGQMRGDELCQEYAVEENGKARVDAMHRMRPGDVDRVSPRIGDVHAVAHGGGADPAISIHVYGANIGAVRRHRFDVTSGNVSAFVSGYDSAVMPNLWDRSKEPAERPV